MVQSKSSGTFLEAIAQEPQSKNIVMYSVKNYSRVVRSQIVAIRMAGAEWVTATYDAKLKQWHNDKTWKLYEMVGLRREKQFFVCKIYVGKIGATRCYGTFPRCLVAFVDHSPVLTEFTNLCFNISLWFCLIFFPPSLSNES